MGSKSTEATIFQASFMWIKSLEQKEIMECSNQQRKTEKRCMKNFTQQKWTRCLAVKEWEDLGKTEDVNEMAQYFNNRVVQALDECAPWKNIKIQKNYKFGVTNETQEFIKERNNVKKLIHLSPNEKKIIHERYRTLCNRVTNQIKKIPNNLMKKGLTKLEMKMKYESW
jgi:hypothetical protein